MRKIFGLLSAAALTFVLAACEKSSDSQQSEAVITSFSIGDFKMIFNDITVDGRDTVAVSTVSGTTVKFSIDQQHNLIFNSDSLPVGSQLDSVTTKISGAGTFNIRKTRKDGTTFDTLWTDKSLFNLSKPLIITVTSNDDSYVRQYTLKTNVHVCDPDSMSWRRLPNTLPASLQDMRAIVLNEDILVYGLDGDGNPSLLSRPLRGNGGWSGPKSCQGLDKDARCKSVTLHNGTLAMLDGSRIMTSTNGTEWKEAGNDLQISYLIPFPQTGDGGTAWAVSADGWIASSTDLAVWTKVQEVPESFPIAEINGLCYPLSSNESILRYVIAGIDTKLNPEHSEIWTKLSTEKIWTRTETAENHSLPCPSLSTLSVIQYDGDLYAFGGKGRLNGSDIAPLKSFYQSSDNGITWRDCSAFFDSFNTWNRFMKFPAELQGCSDAFCYAVDKYNNIWIITDGDSGVWRGYINRLYSK